MTSCLGKGNYNLKIFGFEFLADHSGSSFGALNEIKTAFFNKHCKTYHILSSIVCTFMYWKWCWNISCELYMEGSWERGLRWL